MVHHAETGRSFHLAVDSATSSVGTLCAALEPATGIAYAHQILLLDGATGTMQQSFGLGESDFRGTRFADHPQELKGNGDILTLTRPDLVEATHHAYLEAGSDIIETNTFNSNAPSLGDYGMDDFVTRFNRDAAVLAREV